MKIETKRLILRELTMDDLEALALLSADPEVMFFSISGPTTDKEKVKEYLQKRIIDHYVQYGYGLYAIVHKERNCFIGYMGIVHQNIEGEDKIELGYRLFPNYWGQGLATEAALGVKQYAFNALGINELISIIDPRNVRSLAVARKVGMRYLKESIFHGITVHIYHVKNEWRFTFKPVTQAERPLVHSWLKQPHVAEWFYGQGLENTLKHLDEFLEGSSSSTYWLGYDQSQPFAFLITSSINKPTDELSKWCSEKGLAMTLDLLIGDVAYLGKGYAVQVIQEFLLSHFPQVDEVLIDPEATNLKAVHVYQKAGFKKIGEFVPLYSPNLHYMMRLNLSQLRERTGS